MGTAMHAPPQLTGELVDWYQRRTSGRDVPPLDKPWFIADVAAYLGVGVGTARTYRRRAVRADWEGTRTKAHLPPPAEPGDLALWWWPADIVRWDKQDRPGQGAGGGNPRDNKQPSTNGEKVLSVRQPWAWALFDPAADKDVENRTRSTKYRGRVWIHAGGQPDRRAAGLLPPGVVVPPDLPRGVLLGHVQLVDVVQGSTSRWALPGDDVFHWLRRDPVLLPEPIPMNGWLGLFNMPDDVWAQVTRQLGRRPAGSTRMSG